MAALVPRRGALVLALALSLTLTGLMAVAAAPALTPHATKTLHATEHITLKLVKRTSSTHFVHQGMAKGTAAGTVRSKITLTHAVVLRGTVTITTKRGRVRLKVDGRARSLMLKTPFSGTAKIAGGTGAYAHAHGNGKFHGIVDRTTWDATLDASGTLIY
jgi:hypothetical protein